METYDPVLKKAELIEEELAPHIAVMNQLASEGVDLGDREKIEKAADVLVNDFELGDDFFEDGAKSVLFVSVAHRLVALDEGDVPGREFLYDVMLLVAGSKSSINGDAYDIVKSGNSAISGEADLSLYDRFTNKQVTEDLRQKIKDGGLLDSVRTRLGLTQETEEEYEVRVLNVLDASASHTHSMLRAPDWESVEGDNEALDAALSDRFSLLEYTLELQEKGEEFARLSGVSDVNYAWMRQVGNKKIICLQLPLAEKLAYQDEDREKGYIESGDYERDLAVLEHEYVHTQGSLLTDGHPYISIGIEELRAEHYSGYKMGGYGDVVQHFKYLKAATGCDVRDIFDSYGEGEVFTAASFYQKVAKEVGLDGLLDVISATPRVYEASDNIPDSVRAVHQYTGGLSGLQKKMWDNAISQGREERLRQNLAGIVDRLKEHSIGVGWYVDYVGGGFMGEKLKEIEASKVD